MANPCAISTYLQNKILGETLGGTAYTAPATVYFRLYTVNPTVAGGGTEVSGGSYAVVSKTNNTTTFPAANPTVTGVDIAFAQATAGWGTVIGVGIWDASSAGNLLMFNRLLGARKLVESVDTSGDTLTMTSHGLSNGQRVEVWSPVGTVPGGLTEFTAYYVVGAATNTIQLATTLGGSAINLTSIGTEAIYCALTYQRDVQNGDVFTIPAGQLSWSIS